MDVLFMKMLFKEDMDVLLRPRVFIGALGWLRHEDL